MGMRGAQTRKGYVMDVTLYKCNHCGNVAVKPFDKKVPLSCCGEKMTELVANSTDAAVEKHVPVVSVSGNAVHVEIAFVCLVTEKGYQIAELTSADKPEADFAIAEGDRAIKVYEYCNLHGLWVAEV